MKSQPVKLLLGSQGIIIIYPNFLLVEIGKIKTQKVKFSTDKYFKNKYYKPK